MTLEHLFFRFAFNIGRSDLFWKIRSLFYQNALKFTVFKPLNDLEQLENLVAPLLHEKIERDCSFFSCAP